MVDKSEMIRGDIERTRSEMGDTLDALGYKVNVPARTKGWVGTKKDAVVGACGSAISGISGVGSSAISGISGATDSMVRKVSGATPSMSSIPSPGFPSTGGIQAGAGRLKGTAEQNPIGLAVAGAAVGFVAGLFAPSTTIENEKLGPISDELKSSAVEAGQETIEHAKTVAQTTIQTAAQTASDTASEQARQHGDELSSSLQDKAHDVTQSGSQ